MVEAHDRVCTHSIFCIHNQSKGIHIHIYTWSSYIFQLVLCIFTLGLMGVSYSSVFFPKLNEIINSKISIRIGRSCGLFFRNSKVKRAYSIQNKCYCESYYRFHTMYRSFLSRPSIRL